jgi:DNA-binding response OmpR family regulator
MSSVLLVEDDPALRRLLSRALENAGLTVDAVADAFTATPKLQLGSYSVAIVDVVLEGGRSGVYVIEALNARPKSDRPAVLVITAGDTNSLRSVDRSLVAGILFKPLFVPVFVDVVSTLSRNVEAMRS